MGSFPLFTDTRRPHCGINGGRNKICIDWKMKIVSDPELKPLIYLSQFFPIVTTELHIESG